jgi:hypothetical protein
MAIRTDIAITDEAGSLAALVEVKGKLGTTSDWAAAMRRNLAAHGVLPDAPYFVIATPDRFYVWERKTNNPTAVHPDFSFELTAALRPHLDEVGMEPGELAESSLELLLASWLSELTRGVAEVGIPKAALDRLRTSGFLSLIRGGRVVHQR